MQLFCESHPQIVDVSYGMRPVHRSPDVRPEPVLTAGSPIDASGVSLYGSVIRDAGVYRMWYQAWPVGWTGQDVVAVACVESDDGVHWRRPDLGVLEFAGQKHNNLTNLPFHSPSIIMDPTAPADHRYCAFGYTDPKRIDARYPQQVNRPGYFSAHSRDGLHWTMDSAEPLWPYGDVITAAWDARRQCVRLMMKKVCVIRGMNRRCFYSAEWSNGRCSEPVQVLVPDEYDDLRAQSLGFNSADYYGMGWMPTDGPTVGFLWDFRHQFPATANWGNYGRVDLSLVYQNELTGRWLHLPGRSPWLSADQMPSWAAGALYTSAAAIDVGDETRLYFTGTLDSHGWCGADVNYDEWVKTLAEREGFARIGLLCWPKNRLIGYRANHREWISISPRVDSTAEASLVLNAVTESGGAIRVALFGRDDQKPVSGYEFDDCEPIEGDLRSVAVRWKGQRGLPAHNPTSPIVAKIEITRGTLWAFDFVQA
jgi:hypothetical protein